MAAGRRPPSAARGHWKPAFGRGATLRSSCPGENNALCRGVALIFPNRNAISKNFVHSQTAPFEMRSYCLYLRSTLPVYPVFYEECIQYRPVYPVYAASGASIYIEVREFLLYTGAYKIGIAFGPSNAGNPVETPLHAGANKTVTSFRPSNAGNPIENPLHAGA